MIAFLGTGLLGANFVRAFRRRGEDVQVWNRSPEKARALTEAGATAFDRPAEAVRGASRVHITLSDDAAVDAVLEQARHGFGADTVIIDHTTTAPGPTAERVRRWAKDGIRFLHAPVFMGPSNALDGTGTMLASGDRALFDRVAPALEKMTGKLVYLGDDPSRGAAIKLMGNLFIIVTGAGLADFFALGTALGVPAGEAADMFSWFNPGNAVPWRADRMRTGELTEPSFALTMARKDVRLMLESAAANGATLDLVPAIAADMDRWIDKGHGADDWLVIGADGARVS